MLALAPLLLEGPAAPEGTGDTLRYGVQSSLKIPIISY